MVQESPPHSFHLRNSGKNLEGKTDHLALAQYHRKILLLISRLSGGQITFDLIWRICQNYLLIKTNKYVTFFFSRNQILASKEYHVERENRVIFARIAL